VSVLGTVTTHITTGAFSWVDRTDERQNFGFELLFSYLYQLPPPPSFTDNFFF